MKEKIPATDLGFNKCSGSSNTNKMKEKKTDESDKKNVSSNSGSQKSLLSLVSRLRKRTNKAEEKLSLKEQKPPRRVTRGSFLEDLK